MKLTKEQQTAVKEELMAVVWSNICADWKPLMECVSETLAQKWDEDEMEVYNALFENLDVVKNTTSSQPGTLPLTATYGGN